MRFVCRNLSFLKDFRLCGCPFSEHGQPHRGQDFQRPHDLWLRAGIGRCAEEVRREVTVRRAEPVQRSAAARQAIIVRRAVADRKAAAV